MLQWCAAISSQPRRYQIHPSRGRFVWSAATVTENSWTSVIDIAAQNIFQPRMITTPGRSQNVDRQEQRFRHATPAAQITAISHKTDPSFFAQGRSASERALTRQVAGSLLWTNRSRKPNVAR